ncbi:hypothetical protein EV193_104368 [Herbihabitans rhizosphaerae]|uniref:Uncharacterized protein n=1 Tax=Herbihabitans rhizosphaerae TaxID=1872711 RepID=A0A4Q7KUJ1_9PSEU|nr:hypothetical protein [Herbihabitans rhizosphaerae]RZS39152.1 hypothetical protein EV193_104368 [Herbihabitans rhizosphaerae]
MFREDSTLTPTLILWMVEHLSSSSASSAVLRGGSEHRDWQTGEHLTAVLIDAMNMNTWAVLAKGSKRAPKKPASIPRPGVGRQAPRTLRVADIAAAARKQKD